MPVFDFPTGTIVPHASPIIPTGWISCDGAAYDGTQSTYTPLWSLIGTTYGGSGQSSFNVPNLGRRVPVGPKASTEVSFANPSFATNTTGWTANSSTITRDTSVFDTSPASGRWDNTGASNNLDFGDNITATLNGTFVAGVTYTITWKMRASSSAWLYGYFGDLSTSNYTFKDPINGFSPGVWNTYTIDWTPTSSVSNAVFNMNDRSSFFGWASYYWIDSFVLTSTEGDGGLGTWYGATSHQLSSSQTGTRYHRHGITDPTHNHTFSSNFTNHQHAMVWYYQGKDSKNANRTGYAASGSGGNRSWSTTSSNHGVTWGPANLNNIAVSNTSANASSSHDNVQPEIALNYIIRL